MVLTAKGWQLVENLMTCVLVTAEGRIPVNSRESCRKKWSSNVQSDATLYFYSSWISSV